MKTARVLAILLMATALTLPFGAAASQRVVLMETFTNVSCAPCTGNNPVVHEFVEDFGPAVVVNLQYHVDWPSPSDPFYLVASDDVDGRRAYYGVNSVPTNEIDGLDGPTSDYDLIQTATGHAVGQPAPFEITVGTSLLGDDMTVDVDVEATDVVPGSGLTLHIALVEPHVQINPPPGSNGETQFWATMRKMLPDYTGQTLTISQGQTLQFQEMFRLDPSWVDVYAIVWVQDDSDKSVLQAAASLPNTHDFTFMFGGPEKTAIVPMGLQSFPASLENRGLLNDTYDVHVDWDVPPSWGGGVCDGTGCHDIGENDFTIRLNSGEIEAMTIDIEPFLTLGEGSCRVTATSQAEPSLVWVCDYKVITHGLPILLVDDDGGDPYEQYYQNALDAGSYTHATWDRDIYGKLVGAQLDAFQIVVWNVGWGFPSVDADDRAALSSFLDGGGRLFITGQDIGWDIFDPAGSQSNPAARTWYQNYLGATYLNDDTNDLTIEGVLSDPIGDGLSFLITGGTGANNQQYPSEIEPFGTGVSCLTYDGVKVAAVHNTDGNFMTVYFAFGFEGIAQDTERNLIMQRIMDWFDYDLVGVPGDHAVTPLFSSAPSVSPNPFNPATHVRFEVGGSAPVPVVIDIYNLRGQKVRSLWQGPILPGSQSILWDGRNDLGGRAASGTYMARVDVAGQKHSVKMTLAK